MIPRQYSIVKIKDEEQLLKEYNSEVFDGQRVFIFLGEIPNMPEHYVVAGHTNGMIYSGYHDIFVEVDDG